MKFNTKLNKLSNLSIIKSDVDKEDFPYTPVPPLPKRFSMYLVGSPASGKTTLLTSLLLAHPTTKNKNANRYYYKFFDRVEIISGSIQTLPIEKFGLPPDQLHEMYTDEVLADIIVSIHDDENYNSCLVIDDCIRELTRANKTLCSTILNRRHITQNPNKEGNASLSLIITGQKFNMLSLALRSNMSHVILFKTTNGQELACVKNELMLDLTKSEQQSILDLAWGRPYGFLFIDAFAPKERRYYSNFDLIEFG